MTHLIVNLRGTSGSGKTTVARTFMDRYPHETLTRAGKAVGVRVDVTEFRAPLFLIGTYNNVCGGLDTVPTQLEGAQRAILAYKYGHVLCEGLLVSGVGPGGTMPREIIQAAGENAVFAFLDTPLEVCIARVKTRREARGNTKPFNPANTESKHKQTHDCVPLYKAAGHTTYWIDHHNPYEQVYDLFKKADEHV
jgi:shikimate kinase